MSEPISICLISKAAHGCEKSVNALSEAMIINRKYGSFTIAPCNCNPPCKDTTAEQMEELNKRLYEKKKI